MKYSKSIKTFYKNHIKLIFIFQIREDEYDYSKPVEGQKKRPIEKHWRKHTLGWIDLNSGEVIKLMLSVLKIICYCITLDMFHIQTSERQESG